MNLTNGIDQLLKIAATTEDSCAIIVNTKRHMNVVDNIIDELMSYYESVGDDIVVKRDIRGSTIRNIKFNDASLIISINAPVNGAYVVLDNELRDLRELLKKYSRAIVTDVSEDDVEWCKKKFGVKAIKEYISKIKGE